MSEVTHIIHSAWSIELSLPLADFSAQIAATRRFVDLCCGVGRPVKLFFTSSVTACHKWDVSLGPVPEKALPDPEVATVTGYGAAKYICEHVCESSEQFAIFADGCTTDSCQGCRKRAPGHCPPYRPGLRIEHDWRMGNL